MRCLIYWRRSTLNRPLRRRGNIMDVRGVIGGFIDKHEGGLSMDPKDAGNWFDAKRWAAGQRMVRGAGELVGSKFGVTGAALATFYGTAKYITAKRVSEITRSEAIEIGVALYYVKPGISKLPWGRPVAILLDMGWGSGPQMAIKLFQRSIGVADDGRIGPVTIAAYNTQVVRFGEAKVADAFCLVREAYYAEIASNDGPNDPDKRFLKGWINRARSFLSAAAWWKSWGK